MTQSCFIHASAAAHSDAAVLILGKSGSGKSELLLKLMAWGFDLIGDDQVELSLRESEIWVSAHPNANRRFEIRGVGIFQVQKTCEAALRIVADLDQTHSSRLPAPGFFEIFDQKIPQLNAKGFTPLEHYLYLLLTKRIARVDLDRI